MAQQLVLRALQAFLECEDASDDDILSRFWVYLTIQRQVLVELANVLELNAGWGRRAQDHEIQELKSNVFVEKYAFKYGAKLP